MTPATYSRFIWLHQLYRQRDPRLLQCALQTCRRWLPSLIALAKENAKDGTVLGDDIARMLLQRAHLREHEQGALFAFMNHLASTLTGLFRDRPYPKLPHIRLATPIVQHEMVYWSLEQWWQDAYWRTSRVHRLWWHALLTSVLGLLLQEQWEAEHRLWLDLMYNVADPALPDELRLMMAGVLASMVRCHAEDVFAGVKDALELHDALRRQPLVDLKREFARRIRKQALLSRNPSGTGRKREHEVVESDLTAEEEPSPFETIPDPNTPDPAEVVADEDAVDRVLAQFGERTAQLLRLCLQGYSLSEAARQLGIAPSTAWNLLQRARKKLQKT